MNALALPLVAALLALLATAVVVALLYLLKPPPSTVVVPSSVIWDRVLRESRPRADRLRWWLSLLLAVLIASGMVGAAVQLHPSGTHGVESKLIVVIDDSPTMATRTTDGSTRLEHALAKARALMQARAPGCQIWLADTMRRVVIPAFRSRDEALVQLAQVHVAYGFRPEIVLPEGSSGIETVVITDGVSMGSIPTQARVESVFQSVENAGITAFEVRALPADPRQHVAYIELVNASGVDKHIEFAIVGVGGARISRVVPVTAGGIRHELIDISDFDSGPVRASIALPGDGFAADDVAYAILPVHRVMHVALVTNGNPFLEKALQALPRVQLTVITPERYVDDRGYDALLFDRFAPRRRPLAPSVLFRPPRVDWLPPPKKELANIYATKWNATHALLENISLLDLSVDHATIASLNGRNAAAVVLASAPGGAPLIVANEDGTRWISFSFSLDESNFALQPGFPIFLSNALNWMVGERAFLSRGLGSIEIAVPEARVIAGDGKELPTQSIAGGSLFEANAPGLFTAVSAHERLRIAVNLTDRRISEVNKSTLAQDMAAARIATSAQPPVIDASFWLLFCALLLLLFEWWTWNRSMTV